MEVELNYSGVDQRRSMKKREKRGKAGEKRAAGNYKKKKKVRVRLHRSEDLTINK